MGGIKNKLSNKAKTLLSSLSLKGAVSRRLTGGSSKSGSRLPSFSQPSEMPDGQINGARKLSHLGLYASKTIGSLRLVTLTKYLSIACLSLTILSTLILNITSSYSSSNIESNAIDSNSELSTLANDSSICNPTNTNAAACISLSITPLTTPTSSPCDTSNSNICMTIPDEGGIATGGHTVEVSSNSYAGYNVLLSASEANNDETSLVNTTNGSSSIPTTIGNLTTPSKLDNNTWGYTLANPTGQEANAIWTGLQPSTNKTAIATAGSLSNQTDSYPVYYGVKVDNPSQLLAGDYQTQVVYTATVKLPPAPTNLSASSTSYELGSGADSTVTITGTNLASTYKVYIESNTDSTKQYDITNTITNLTDTELTVAIPTDQTNPDLEPGDYTIHVVTQGGEAEKSFKYIDPILTIIFNSNGGAGTMNPLQVRQGDEQALPSNTFTRDGYTFNGWNTLADGTGTAYANGATYAASIDSGGQTLTLYAQWQLIINHLDDVTYMQDLTASQCASSTEGATATLTDRRDNNKYRVTKMGEGCWMTQNLNLASGTRITSADSNVSSSYTIPSASFEGNSPSYTAGRAQAYDSASYPSYHYNFCAASAGTKCNNDKVDSTYDICPKGWHLPSTKEASFFGEGSLSERNVLYQMFNDYGTGNWNAASTASESYTYGKGGTRYWLSTAGSANGYQYTLARVYYTSSRIYVMQQSFHQRFSGFAVRCTLTQ